jgi:hypothetical protein
MLPMASSSRPPTRERESVGRLCGYTETAAREARSRQNWRGLQPYTSPTIADENPMFCQPDATRSGAQMSAASGPLGTPAP